MEEDTLYLQLHKLSAIESEEALDHMLSTLWRTRKTGLRTPEKSHFQSLLNIPSLPDVDLVLACLRSLIRKCTHGNFTSGDLLKLFPPDLSLDLQSLIILSFQKHQGQWKEDLSKEQNLSPSTSIAYQAKTNVPPSFSSFPYSEISALSWLHQDDPVSQLNHNDMGATPPLTSETINESRLAPQSFQHDFSPTDNLAIIPPLKSVTWAMESCSSALAHRKAIISLKLHDKTKSPSGEMEVKFQLTRDTLEAMLRSLTYISKQLSSAVGTSSERSSEPANKKQKQ